MDTQAITPLAIEAYCVEQSTPVPAIFQELEVATRSQFPQAAHMQVGPTEGNFLKLLVQISGAVNVLEFGTFTGYSALIFAMAIPDHGKVVTLDRDPVATKTAQHFWTKAGMRERIDLRLGDAKLSLSKIAEELKDHPEKNFDLIFIDADKASYGFYFDASFELLKKGGLIISDNVLRAGKVLDPEKASERAMHAYNEKLKQDPRIELVMLPIRDGITIARKRA